MICLNRYLAHAQTTQHKGAVHPATVPIASGQSEKRFWWLTGRCRQPKQADSTITHCNCQTRDRIVCTQNMSEGWHNPYGASVPDRQIGKFADNLCVHTRLPQGWRNLEGGVI